MEAFIIGNKGAGNNSGNGGGNISITPFQEKILYDSENVNGTIVRVNNTLELSESLNNFDSIRIEWGYAVSNSYIAMSNEYTSEFLEKITQLLSQGTWAGLTESFLNGYDNKGIGFVFTNDTTLKVTEVLGGASNYYIRRIIGTIEGAVNNDSIYNIDKILALKNGTEVNTLYNFIDNHTLAEYDELYIVISNNSDIANLNRYEQHSINVQSLRDTIYAPILINSYSTRHIVCDFSNTGLTVTTSYGENANYALKIYYIYGIKYNGIVTVNNPNGSNSNNNNNNNLSNIDNYILDEEILTNEKLFFFFVYRRTIKFTAWNSGSEYQLDISDWKVDDIMFDLSHTSLSANSSQIGPWTSSTISQGNCGFDVYYTSNNSKLHFRKTNINDTLIKAFVTVLYTKVTDIAENN